MEHDTLELAIMSVKLPTIIFSNIKLDKGETLMKTIGAGIVAISRNESGTYGTPQVMYR